MDYSSILGGLYIPSQIPLDVKRFVESEEELSNLGPSNAKAYSYYQGMVVYCFVEQSRWEWREVSLGEENTGLLSNDYTYDDEIFGLDVEYSNRVFNFFPYAINGEKGDKGDKGDKGLKGDQGIQGIQGIQGVQGMSGSNGIDGDQGLSAYDLALSDGYIGSLTDWILSLQGPQGVQGVQGINGIDASNNLQKIITNNYVLSDIDNNYTILVNNGVSNVEISIPNGLLENISIAFIQQGEGDVEFVMNGNGTIFSPSGRKIKSQYNNAYLEQIGTTNDYHLIGNLK